MHLEELQSVYDFTDRTVLLTGGTGVLDLKIALGGVVARLESLVVEGQGLSGLFIGDYLSAWSEAADLSSERHMPYFLKVGSVKNIPLGGLAHSKHLRGSGVMENGMEKPNVKVTLASWMVSDRRSIEEIKQWPGAGLSWV